MLLLYCCTKLLQSAFEAATDNFNTAVFCFIKRRSAMAGTDTSDAVEILAFFDLRVAADLRVAVDPRVTVL